MWNVESKHNLENSVDLQAYLDKSSSLAADFDGRDFAVRGEVADATIYELALEPEDFFLFGSGFGDAKSDMAPMTELVVEWKDGKPEFNEERSLIPATSLKGRCAIAHCITIIVKWEILLTRERVSMRLC